MKLEISQKTRPFRFALAVSAVVGAAVCVYIYSGNVLLSLLPFLLAVWIPYLMTSLYRKRYREYLSKFGEDGTQKYRDENIYDKSIYGFVPFEDRFAHCSIYADDSGILVGKLSTKRFVSWGAVVGHRVHDNEKGKYLELNVGNLYSENRLFIPWSDSFSSFLPENS